MQVNIVGKKYNVSQRLESIIESKLDKFSRYFDENTVINVVCKQNNKDLYTMEVTFKFGDNKVLRSEITTENMYSNIDIILPKIEKQLRRYKTVLQNKLKDNAYKEEMFYGEDTQVEKTQEIVRKKSFDLQPMSVKEAMVELNLVGNDFFVFFNVENAKVNVLYKRHDGDVGLIDLNY